MDILFDFNDLNDNVKRIKRQILNDICKFSRILLQCFMLNMKFEFKYNLFSHKILFDL